MRAVRALVVVCGLTGALGLSCGYQPIRAQAETRGALSVTAVGQRSAEPQVDAAVLAGVGLALSQEGLLRNGNAYPRIEVELLRIERLSGAVGLSADDRPRARSIGMAVLARAWVALPDGTHVEDTGDVREEGYRAAAARGAGEIQSDEEALQAVALRLGKKLGARILGYPVSSGTR
jgi:hypothetical protein